MSEYLFPPAPTPGLAVKGRERLYPVTRIFCVGRNFAAHAAEMGNEVNRDAPWYFTKSQTAFLASGSTLPMPPRTENFHHEMELTVAIGAEGFKVPVSEAQKLVFGFGCGLDMTRRDLQATSKERRQPWCTGKDVEGGAVLGPLTPAAGWKQTFQRIELRVNGEKRQDGSVKDLVWSVAEIISDLSHLYHLRPGDIIMTGTPAGVGPVEVGDVLEGTIGGLEPVTLTIGPAE
ncbi:fumarylacetoacetate hydrolase family protein [Alphaproteobacteria bacterium KMM 3653]|uniref:Fumarylacetoacetate hydrolase family protein n=1 Tax=Harenicola maris TaxID=2841044 RepID=A0AAP2CN91_9RHOB|nr:fumarylacetoacetate hydrolase family protein [Harenicola maris]